MNATVTGTTTLLPIVSCSGTARARGQAHGEGLRELIATGLDRWLTLLARAHRQDADSYIRDFLDETDHLPAIQRWTPDLLEEVRGIAEGANQPFNRILAYNLLDEEWSYAEARGAGATGCTAVGYRTAEGTPVIAQNMDIPEVHDGTQAVLRLQPTVGPEQLVFTFAGCITLMGVNAVGVGVVVNSLSMLPDSRAGLPVAFAIRGILTHLSAAAAAAFVESVPHAIGQHYGIGGPDGFFSLEAAANGVIRDTATPDRILHTNHPLVNLAVVSATGAEEAYLASNTHARYDLAASRATELHDLADVEQVLADTTTPVSCLAAPDGFMTFGSMAAELTVPPRVHFASGPPHATPYVEVGWVG